MKKSTKAALFSAFVFPGVGHIFLKKYLTGAVLAGVALVVISYLVSKSIEIALQITDGIQSGNVPLDVVSITELVSQQPTGTEAVLLDVATYVFIICWLIGVIDAYREGQVQDKKDELRANN